VGIDTAQKRYSLIGFGSPTPRLLPIPQGTIEADDRALLLYLYAGLTLAEAAATEAETPSGGWRRKGSLPFRQREQTAEEIKAERVRMGILPPEPSKLDADHAHSINTDTAGDTSVSSVFIPPNEQSVSLAAHLLPEDLAGLEALAARAAQLTIDQEIALWLKLDQQRRLHEAWLQDEDDAAVLMLAIATIH
jgi:hypothetical protein